MQTIPESIKMLDFSGTFVTESDLRCLFSREAICNLETLKLNNCKLLTANAIVLLSEFRENLCKLENVQLSGISQMKEDKLIYKQKPFF